ncbi:hypoxanthine phosphoribosyltransferase [Mycoplasma sp. 'Moose RK']|nr:hypoxanthine phosphoribosyltransferase [Mycoplasma sp. 'Moose RK']
MKSKHITKVLYTQQEIEEKISEIAEWINFNYKSSDTIIFVGVLKGSLMFIAELIKKIKIDCIVDFVIAKSYFGGTESTGQLKIITDIDTEIKNKDVILLDDILDSGITLAKIRDHLMLKEPKSLRVVTLFDKKSKRKYNIEADFSGFVVPDVFLVGFGLDYQDKYRNWPFVVIFDPEK